MDVFQKTRSLALCTILLLTIHFSTLAQEVIEFEVSVAGFNIGEMTAKKSIQGANSTYEINSNVGFWFFGTVSVDFKIRSQYEGKLLTAATATTKSNKGDFHSNVKWIADKGEYKINATSYKYKLDTVVNRPFHFSSVKLYFEEPKQQNEFMAENFGLPSPIRKVNDYYEVNVNGNKNRFFYSDGKLVKAIMQSPIKNYVITRKNP